MALNPYDTLQGMPLWQAYGFASPEQFNAAYNQPSPPPPLASAPPPTAPPPPSAAAPTAPAPAPAPAVPVTDPTAAADQERQRAANWGIVRGILQQYGLDDPGLLQWAQQMVMQDASPEQIQVELYNQPAVRTRYPGVFERTARGLPPISIADALAYENQAIQLMRSAGLPASFYDQPADVHRFIGLNVSMAELGSRVNEGIVAAFTAPREVRDELERIYGVGPGEIAAYFLDESRALPIIQRQFEAAQIAGVSRRTGFGQISRTEAESLSAMGLRPEQTAEGFGQLVELGEVFRALPGQEATEETIGREEQFGAVFGQNAQERRRLRRQQERRLAQFGGGGGFAAGREGLVGLGTA